MYKDETVWATQKAMAALFDVGTPAINKHLTNIFAEGELKKEATVSKMEIVQTEGNREVKRMMELYNLDAIISVGYRVNSIPSLCVSFSSLILVDFYSTFSGTRQMEKINFVYARSLDEKIQKTFGNSPFVTITEDGC